MGTEILAGAWLTVCALIAALLVMIMIRWHDDKALTSRRELAHDIEEDTQ